MIIGTLPCRSIGPASAVYRSCSSRTSLIGAPISRGAAKSTSIRRPEWDHFFNDYQTWIVEMARIAEAHGAAIFCVGLEFSACGEV